MLLKEEFFQTFTLKPLSLGKQSTEVLLSLQVNTKDEVNQMLDKAIKLGAQEYNPPTDNGFMYLRVFEDLDGHQWEISWIDEMYNWDDLKQ